MERFEPRSLDLTVTLGISLIGSETYVDASGHERVRDLPTVEGTHFSEFLTAEGAIAAPATAFLGRADDVIDTCATISRFSCCHLRAGVDIVADGFRWTDGLMDHFWGVRAWVLATKAILDGGDHAETTTFTWSQSTLVLRRSGSELTLCDYGAYDGHPTNEPVPFMPMRVELSDFVRRLAEQGRAFERMCTELREAIARRGYDVRRLAQALSSDDKPHAATGDTALVCAILARETDTTGLAETLTALERF